MLTKCNKQCYLPLAILEICKIKNLSELIFADFYLELENNKKLFIADTEKLYTIATDEFLAPYNASYTYEVKAKVMGMKQLDACQVSNFDQ